MYEEEKRYLLNVLEKINLEINKSNEELKILLKKGTSLSYEDRKRGEHFNINTLATIVNEKIGMLTRSIPTPYFGRIDLEKNGKIYIGKSGIISNGNILVTDWRAPISSIYYDSELGKVSYKAPEGNIYDVLNAKSQINIKNSKLLDVQDTTLVTNDELLKPYLSENADNKMKIIIASIQKEQNSIIRKGVNSDNIIQGVAGSGKTSVALHRIAYLIYQLGDSISSDKFLVIGPNDYFLNYISSVLPDLETRPVSQKTFFNFCKEYLNVNFTIKYDSDIKENNSLKKFQKIKSTLEYKDLLDSFMDNFFKNGIVKKDFMINECVVFDKKFVENNLYLLDKNTPNYKKGFQVLNHHLKSNIDNIYNIINKKYKDIYTKLPFDSDERKKILEKSDELHRILKKDGSKLLKKFFKEIILNPMDLYMKFIDSISFDDLNLTNEEFMLFKEETCKNLKKKKIGFEDLPALIHIQFRCTKNVYNYKYLIIDEAQDYGLFHFYVLKEINPKSRFDIYGDLAQSIYSYRSIKSWEDVNNYIFNGNCDKHFLNKSYRTTMQITQISNLILDKLGLNFALPVVRNGKEVVFINKSNDIIYKVDKINHWLENGYKTIAIICKTEKEAEKLNDDLINNGINSKYISDKNYLYEGGIFVLTSTSSKGLEFDCVLVNNASNSVYDEFNDVDMHLLYVAVTRALHELEILYDNEICNIFKK